MSDNDPKIVAYWLNDWDILNSRKTWNWECVHIIQFRVERDNVCRTFDLDIALIGLGFHVHWYAPDWMFPRNTTRERACDIAESIAGDGAPVGQDGD